jgi:DNA-binding winged helix-turn-helix (wHTH) protein
MATREVYQFREFTLDVGERRLARGEVQVRLPPKAQDLLVMLVRQPGRLLTKDELLARIWPDTFVEESILTVHVSAVRKALGDDARLPTYIETVSGSGYRSSHPCPSRRLTIGQLPLVRLYVRSKFMSSSDAVVCT